MRIRVLLPAIALAVSLAACGGGSFDEELTFRADVGDSDDSSTTLQETADAIEQRAAKFGLSEYEVETEAPDLVTVRLNALNRADAVLLFTGEPTLDIQRPVVDEQGNVACQGTDGAEFSIAPEEITYETMSAPGLPACPTEDGNGVSIIWEPAATTDNEGNEQVLTEESIEPGGANVGNSEPPGLVITLTEAGNLYLSQITEEMVGLPLGIALDGRLVAGPTVSERIVTGNVAIGGIAEFQARVLAAQLSYQLPVSIEDVSGEAE